MLFTDIAALPSGIAHICLSPHFDDAALSLGGTLALAADHGQPPLIVTICSAPPSSPLTPFAAQLHARWGGAANPIAVRQAEDQAAAAVLGADVLFGGICDAIYRDSRYSSGSALFDTPVAADSLLAATRALIAALQARYPAARWYAPLAVGNHVDHQLVSAAARASALSDLWWYEDLPYSTLDAAVSTHLAAFNLPLVPRLIDISAVLPRKLDAIAAYASQMLELFGDEATMRTRIGSYASTLGASPAAWERLWHQEAA